MRERVRRVRSVSRNGRVPSRHPTFSAHEVRRGSTRTARTRGCGPPVSVLPPDIEHEPGDGHEQARDPQPGHSTSGFGPVVVRHRDHLRCQRRRTRGAEAPRGACVTGVTYAGPERLRSGRLWSLWHSTRRANRSPSPLPRWWASTLPGVRRPATRDPGASLGELILQYHAPPRRSVGVPAVGLTGWRSAADR